MNDTNIDWNRPETDPCEKGTPGCCVIHRSAGPELSCETW